MRNKLNQSFYTDTVLTHKFRDSGLRKKSRTQTHKYIHTHIHTHTHTQTHTTPHTHTPTTNPHHHPPNHTQTHTHTPSRPREAASGIPHRLACLPAAQHNKHTPVAMEAVKYLCFILVLVHEWVPKLLIVHQF